MVVDRLGDRGQVAQPRQASPGPASSIPTRSTTFLATHPPLEARRSISARSARPRRRDGDLVWATNVELPLRLWRWCAAQRRAVHLRLLGRDLWRRRVPASTTRLAGRAEPAAAAEPVRLDQARLRPPRRAHARSAGEPRPPQWVGLKFFNVYGPNEYHKGPMISVVKVKHDEIAAGGPARLFRSDRPGLADGEQQRDFIWVGDVVDGDALAARSRPTVNGLFNVGTGQARSYLDLARAVCRRGRGGAADRIHRHARQAARPIPVLHRGAHRPAARGRATPRQFTPLEEGVRPLCPGLSGGSRTPTLMIPVLLFPAVRPGSRPGRAARHPLVRARLYRRTGPRLAAAAAAGAGRPAVATPLQADDFLTWATLGVVLGGRLGYVLFYQPSHYLADPLRGLRGLAGRHELPWRRARA